MTKLLPRSGLQWTPQGPVADVAVLDLGPPLLREVVSDFNAHSSAGLLVGNYAGTRPSRSPPDGSTSQQGLKHATRGTTQYDGTVTVVVYCLLHLAFNTRMV